MSTIFIAAVLIISTIGLLFLFVQISKNNRNNQNEKKLNSFRQSGTKNGLFFSRQEILENKIIGLDEVNKTLLIYDFKNEDNVVLINIVKVRTCLLKKNYENINIGNEKKVSMEKRLASIDLIFEFKYGGEEPVSVSFYDSTINNIYEMTELEAKAKEWETILSKILFKKFEVTA